MQKNPNHRSEVEVDRVIKLLKSFPFFKNNENLSYCDYRDLAQLMTYKEFSAGSTIYTFQDHADNFYVLLNGYVSEEIKNPYIDEWDWANNVYKTLLEWKEKTFDPFVRKSLEEFKAI